MSGRAWICDSEALALKPLNKQPGQVAVEIQPAPHTAPGKNDNRAR